MEHCQKDIAMPNEFSTGLNQKNILSLRALLDELPEFLRTYFRGIADNTSIRTRVAYAYDLKLFFNFLMNNKYPQMEGISAFRLDCLEDVTPDDIEQYMEYLSYYTYTGDDRTEDRQNNEHGKSRKLAALRTMYSYFHKKRKIEKNPSELVDFPKIHQKTITRLEVNEVAALLDEVESGEKLTEHQKKFHKLSGSRDLAIVTLLLGTGMRVSECVGINVDDLDFDINGVRITRKGGNEAIVYFGREVEEALLDYLCEREKVTVIEGHEDALFLSLQRKRITPRAVQNLVRKYAKIVTPIKTITPHKLRSTFGTNLYMESGDIYLVADALGHADVNTTKKHYANMEDARRREVVKFVKLREED
jgi:site-specific recombinase XerD